MRECVACSAIPVAVTVRTSVPSPAPTPAPAPSQSRPSAGGTPQVGKLHTRLHATARGAGAACSVCDPRYDLRSRGAVCGACCPQRKPAGTVVMDAPDNWMDLSEEQLRAFASAKGPATAPATAPATTPAPASAPTATAPTPVSTSTPAPGPGAPAVSVGPVRSAVAATQAVLSPSQVLSLKDTIAQLMLVGAERDGALVTC
jgi:hypothetical protein